MNILHKWITWRQKRINDHNRKRLNNYTPTIICSNCTGGMVYHWLGLKFYSPFINLYMTNLDFIKAMERFDDFIDTPILEDNESKEDYPIGIGHDGVRIHFLHYKTFNEAIQKWEQRKKRIDRTNMCIWLSNFNSANHSPSEQKEILERFNKLPFKNKLLFSGTKIDFPFVVYLKGYKKVESQKNIFNTKDISGKRYIDYFDYVSYLNSIKN